MKTLILILATAAVLFGNDCSRSADNFKKYASRVITAKKFGEKPSSFNLDMAIHYGIESIADCDGLVDEEGMHNAKNSVQILIDIKKGLR
jgi:hypothetical protein